MTFAATPLSETVDVLRELIYIGWFLLGVVVVLRSWDRLPGIFERLPGLLTPWGFVPFREKAEEKRKEVESAVDEAVSDAGEALVSAPRVIQLGAAIEKDAAGSVGARISPAIEKDTAGNIIADPDVVQPSNLNRVITEIREQQRARTEELIRLAALWGWTKNEEGYVEPPEPIVHWDGDRPRITGERGGAYDALVRYSRKVNRAERARDDVSQRMNAYERILEQLRGTPPTESIVDQLRGDDPK